MIFMNEVKLMGKVVKIYPPKEYESGDKMIIADILTLDSDGEFIHRVSFLNELSDDFLNNFDIDDFIKIDAKLCPRPMNRNNPSGAMFFDIRCLKLKNIEQEGGNATHWPPQQVIPPQEQSPVNNQDGSQSPFMVCSPTIPVTTISTAHTKTNRNQEAAWDSDFNHGDSDASNMEYLNGAPIDKSLPFFPENGRTR